MDKKKPTTPYDQGVVGIDNKLLKRLRFNFTLQWTQRPFRGRCTQKRGKIHREKATPSPIAGELFFSSTHIFISSAKGITLRKKAATFGM
jgi:hypothetical protein